MSSFASRAPRRAPLDAARRILATDTTTTRAGIASTPGIACRALCDRPDSRVLRMTGRRLRRVSPLLACLVGFGCGSRPVAHSQQPDARVKVLAAELRRMGVPPGAHSTSSHERIGCEREAPEPKPLAAWRQYESSAAMGEVTAHFDAAFGASAGDIWMTASTRGTSGLGRRSPSSRVRTPGSR